MEAPCFPIGSIAIAIAPTGLKSLMPYGQKIKRGI